MVRGRSAGVATGRTVIPVPGGRNVDDGVVVVMATVVVVGT